MDVAALAVDRSGGGPLYLQLAEALDAAAGRGDLALGERLPSERDLAGTLGLSRTTVVAAYRELEARGLVRGHVGRGTFVVGGAGAEDEGAPFAWRGKLAAGAGRLVDPALRALVDDAPAGTISLGPGVPALDLFPLDATRRAADRVLRRGAAASLGLLPTEGHPALREALAARHGARPEEVLVVSGAQQGLDLVSRCLVDPGDAVVVDRPGYLGAVQAVLAAGARVVGWDAERADPGELEDLLLRHRPKLLYTTPTFQNPTGRTLDLAARREVLRVARRHRVPVVEDDPYRELGFPGTPAPPPTLRELDDGGLVIGLGTVSKTLAAGLRLGWVLAPAAIVGQLALVKARADVFGGGLPQLVVHELLAGDVLAAHVRALRAEHERRHRALVRALERRLRPGALRFAPARGGLYLWCRLPPAGPDATTLQHEAARAGVAVVAGRPLYADGGGERHVRLCFAGVAPAQLDEAAARLAPLLPGAGAGTRPRARAAPPLV